LRELNESLHEASQPMTVLLCTLEYGGSLDSMEEMRQMIALSQEACERLRITVQRMQARVREAIEAHGTATANGEAERMLG